jgi:hypothetical protein
MFPYMIFDAVDDPVTRDSYGALDGALDGLILPV